VVRGHTRSCGCLRLDYLQSEKHMTHCERVTRKQRACIKSALFRAIDPGTRFGMLVVHSEWIGTTNSKGVHYNCICDCGNTSVVRGTLLRYGQTRSCGCMKFGPKKCLRRPSPVRSGAVFGMLKVMRLKPVIGVYGRSWRCRCECGNRHIARERDLNYGTTKSCGCLKRKRCAEARKVFAFAFAR